MMKDSTVSAEWLRSNMQQNPPCVLPPRPGQTKGDLFSGPVRLSFPNIFNPGQPGTDGGDPKYGAALLFPPGTDMSIFENAWKEAARASFPNNWTPEGQPVGLHIPFHDQQEKAYAAKPLRGYTPGGITFAASSKYKPTILDLSKRPLTDESKIYPGVWAFVTMNVYEYGIRPARPKKGISFGLQAVMIIADDDKLGGGGADLTKTFDHVKITAESNVAAKFGSVGGAQKPATPSLMPSGGHAGQSGGMAVQPLEDLSHLE